MPGSASRRIARFTICNRGAVGVLTAVGMLFATSCLALAIDVGSLYLSRRQLQSITDLAAMAAARDLSRAETAARATYTANGMTNLETLTVTTGRYEGDPAKLPSARFGTPASGATINAAHVTVLVKAPLFFGRLIMKTDTVDMSASATAVETSMASFYIGSRLASINDGLLNTLLTGLLGGSVNLTLMDYNALSNFKIDLLDFTKALGTRLNLTAGTYDQVLSSQATVGNVLGAMADVASRDSSTRAAEIAINKILAVPSAITATVPAGRLINLGPYGSLGLGETAAGFSARAAALEMLRAVAEAASGARQVNVNLGASVPGLLGLTATIMVGERPQGSSWVSMGSAGMTVYTAQTRLRLLASVGGSGILLGATIQVPVYLDVAAAQATLSSVSCGANPTTDARVSVSAKPSLANLWIGDPSSSSSWNNFSALPTMQSATLVTVPLLLSARAAAHAQITNNSAQTLDFTAQNIADNTVKTINSTGMVGSLLSSAIGDLDIQIQVLGIGIPGIATALLNTLLSPVPGIVDPVLDNLLATLGIGVGEADVGVSAVRCDGSALAG